MEINKQTAKRIYPEQPQWFKDQLVEEFGEETFREESFEKIKTFELACEATKVDPASVFNDKDLPDEIAYKKLKVITRAVNQGWVPDWNNTNQCKWWPWFNLSSGFGFSGSYFGFGHTLTDIGSRLCFESEEKSDFVANQFIDLYKDLLTITQ